MTPLVMLLVMAAAQPVDPDLLPPDPEPPDPPRTLPSSGEAPAIFTYSVDGRCRVADPRKLQGSESRTWPEAEGRYDVYRETTLWRFLDGMRRQLRERRVKLMGEMVREGVLVCHLQPSGEVVDAWIEREDDGSARRRAPTRQPVAVSDGEIEHLGTFSLELPDTGAVRR